MPLKMRIKILFPIALALSVAQVYGEIGSTVWETETSIDDFTDEKKTFSIVAAAGGMESGFIILGCYPSGFEAKVGTGNYIGDKNIAGNVKYRVDSDTPVKTTMKPTSKSYVYFNDMNSQFIQDLMNGKEHVLIQLTSYDYDTSKAKFTLNGSTAAIKTVLDDCRGR